MRDDGSPRSSSAHFALEQPINPSSSAKTPDINSLDRSKLESHVADVKVQADDDDQISRRRPQAGKHPPESGHDSERAKDTEDDDGRTKAALTIQRYYRGHRARKHMETVKLQREARWKDLIKQTGEIAYTHAQLSNKNDVRSRWHRAIQAVSRLQASDGLYDPPSASYTHEVDPSTLDEKVLKARRATFLGSLSLGVGKKERDENETLPFHSKTLEQQHWLEMIDGKHRYGSNMKYYFRKWKEADTKDNFFRWLDKGEGKDLDLEELPRERFEKERIIYLSAEQRLNYLVKVDRGGRLRWVRNDELVDTAAGKWRDSGDGSGIVPDDSTTEPQPELAKKPSEVRYGVKDETSDREEGESSSDSSTKSISSASYSAGSDLDDNEDTHYAGLDKEDDGWWEKRKKRLTPGGIRKELLRKTVRRNTWIYVSDMNLNLFVGIKQSGSFQHSSFLAGGKVTSAGIIVVKQGLVKSLNPLSGHYRSSIDHYRAFIAQLESKGVDLSHVKLAKSVLSLWGLSKYSRTVKKQQNLLTHFKRGLHLSHEPTEEEKSAELQENAEREEAEHQERMKKVKEAEREVADEGQGEEEMRRVRKEVLYGKGKREDEERKEDTKRELHPV
ncbi:hypothetical protein CI109_101005 [Kwoniella shandongensis]|uniref:Uncharacterized protein n=1 Tax=Kwoniella shandongensis TaxID=1734106 RepID=A0A5M6C5P4_9TREE|nr:uncharacterized protein CI109_001474 [Kwoniella shandongensis]KAA5530070.1 hypothetical protein CI109_001474 [Kwoniella shandongensis]